jgi:hypothetical protein
MVEGKIHASRGASLDTYTWNRFEAQVPWVAFPDYAQYGRQSTWRMQVPTTAPIALENYTDNDFWVPPVPGGSIGVLSPDVRSIGWLPGLFPGLAPVAGATGGVTPVADTPPIWATREWAGDAHSNAFSVRVASYGTRNGNSTGPTWGDSAPPGGVTHVSPPIVLGTESGSAATAGVHSLSPPSPFVKEAKVRAPAHVQKLLSAPGVMTEIKDVVDSLYAGLSQGDRRRSDWSWQLKLQRIIQKADQVNWPIALKNVVMGHIGDLLAGTAQQLHNKVIGDFFRKAGVEPPLGFDKLIQQATKEAGVKSPYNENDTRTFHRGRFRTRKKRKDNE